MNDIIGCLCRYHLKDTVLEGGIPFNKAYGMNVFDYHGTDPRFNKVFNKGMSDPSTIVTKKLLENYKGFEGLTSLVDVGGGTGAVVYTIVSKYPSIKGINFDLPHTIENALSYPGIKSFLYNSCCIKRFKNGPPAFSMELIDGFWMCRCRACWGRHVC